MARAEAIAELAAAAAADLRIRYLKRDRIPAVVRRPIAAPDGMSLLDLLAQGKTRDSLTRCRDTFAFENMHG